MTRTTKNLDSFQKLSFPLSSGQFGGSRFRNSKRVEFPFFRNAKMNTVFNMGKRFYENVELTEEHGETTNSKFAFPRQCLVLGDPRVGKTSLVKSLTGGPFDRTEKSTQGIDLKLVDHEWKTCDMKDLIFGDPRRYLKAADVKVGIIGTGKQHSKVLVGEYEFLMTTSLLRFYLYFSAIVATCLFITATVLKVPASYLLFYFVYYECYVFPICDFHFGSNIRFITATIAFILNRRGLLIGLYSAMMICPFDLSYVEFAGTRKFLILSIFAAIAFVTLFLFVGPIQLPFGAGQLVKNQNFTKFLCICRFPLSILIGLISGFVVAMSFWRLNELCYWEHAAIKLSVNSTSHQFHDLKTLQRVANCTNQVFFLIFCSLFTFVFESPRHILETPCVRAVFLHFIEKDMERWPYMVMPIFGLYYYTRVIYHILTSPSSTIYYFVVSFPLYVCITLFDELFCGNSDGVAMELVHPFDSCVTLALIRNGEINPKLLRSALKSKYPFLKMKIFDFAGDKEYYSYHHMFLKRHALYLIVFKIADLVESDFQNVCTGLRYWFESVCSHVQPKTPIFLIGTHSEQIGKKHLEILNVHLKNTFWAFYCDELIVNDDEGLIFFPVENSKGENDVGVQKLRDKIMAAAEESKPTLDQNVPLSWIRIQDAIIQLRTKKDARYCVTLREFPWAFDNYIHTDWSIETLKYFHEHGLVVYPTPNKNDDLSNWVLLKPEILVDIIIQLVTPSLQITQQRGLRSDWQLLQKKGMLTKTLMSSIISKVKENEEAMIAFLEEYDLICPLTNPEVKIVSLRDKERLQPTHFVPSLLPKSQEECIPVWHDDKSDQKFFLFFERFLPESLFHRLLSRAHKNSQVEFANGATVVFIDVGKFWMSPSEPYRLKLMKKESLIEVTFSTR